MIVRWLIFYAACAILPMREKPKAPTWYPDWRGQTAVLIASGPSVKAIDLAQIKGAKVAAVNNSYQLVPNADVLYACDYTWWKKHAWAHEFKGLKICGELRAARDGRGVEAVQVLHGDDRMQWDFGRLGRGGGSSGFQLVNLVAQWGAAKIIRCGYDCSIKDGVHWHGPHQGLLNPSFSNTVNWKRALDAADIVLRLRGVEVVDVKTTEALCLALKPTELTSAA